jgi:predicted metalloprotease with PDZ domain
MISDFESHPARHSQSPEASSLEAWMEGHPYYRRPERSISYYISGEVLGVLLDLRLRALTHGTKSLRDLFQAMNKDFTKQGRFYDDARGVQQAAESVSGASLEDFFAGHVRGTRDIAYDEFFRWVGLKLESVTTQVGDAGFDASINFSGLPEVTAITPASTIEAAGVRVGDKLEAIDDREYLGDLGSYLGGRKAGETVNFRFNAHGKIVNVKVVLKSASDQSYTLVDLPNVTAEQRAQRAAWIKGEDIAPGAKR